MDTPSKASGSSDTSVALERGEKGKKRKRSTSTCLASLGHAGLVASVVESLYSEEEKDEGIDLVSMALVRY